ncbi:MAG: 3D domain-containing protein [Armatimonadota bacterium]
MEHRKSLTFDITPETVHETEKSTGSRRLKLSEPLQRGAAVLLLLSITLAAGTSASAASKKKKHHTKSRTSKSRSVAMRVSFYCGGCDHSRRTRTGRPFSLPGVAVDPDVIPLGSRVFVPGYGWRTADDTGGRVQGNRIDVRLGSRGNCQRLGVQRKTVRFIRPKSKTRK